MVLSGLSTMPVLVLVLSLSNQTKFDWSIETKASIGDKKCCLSLPIISVRPRLSYINVIQIRT